MKQIQITLLSILVTGVALTPCQVKADNSFKPRVVVTLDACLDCGNPDDIHALVHLLWHSNEIDLEGLLPDRYDVFGDPVETEAIEKVLDAYEADYNNTLISLADQGFPDPTTLRELIPDSQEDALDLIETLANEDNPRPLFILGWGNMRLLQETLTRDPSVAEKIRVITVGTRTNYNNCREPNLNGWGRNAIFQRSQFDNMWWIELDWAQEAMQIGEEPVKMLDALSRYGDLGQILADSNENSKWGRGFRGGDIAPLLILLDPSGSVYNPTKGGWLGKLAQPFPERRPNYFTDNMGKYEWDYEKPCRTWIDRELALKECQAALLKNRPVIYAKLLERLNSIYPTQTKTQSIASYEAENAELTEDLRVRSDLEASHGFYVEMKGNGRITWVLEDVPADGEYKVKIRYKLPFHHQTQRLILNGEDLGMATFDGSARAWQEKEFALPLKEGRNSLTVEKDWGYMDFDNVILALNEP
ncbi:MAG: DUF1593 domain-containing protein [Candidatus Omnitrophica bacterium]|nr:DUF1593 domain-containing protein [Candidatus Omnitrophota bacterium]MCA9445675.1 DUF1593 domain-containing protein [Candidatus Omnitrophota bacterium]